MGKLVGTLDLIWSTSDITRYMWTQEYLKIYWYSRVPFTTHRNDIYVFCWLRLSGWCRITGSITKSQLWSTICKNWWNKVGSPKINCNHVSSLPEQTWCTSKGGTDITNMKCTWDRTTKGGHSCTTNGVKNNQCTIYKGGYK